MKKEKFNNYVKQLWNARHSEDIAKILKDYENELKQSDVSGLNSLINIERQELIELCKDAVIHHTKWNNRDSYSAQKNIQSIYKGLTAGLEYRIVTKEIDPIYHSDNSTLIIEFLKPIDLKKLDTGKHLDISSREDYFRDCDPEHDTEMFNGEGIDFLSSYTEGYMPTRKLLEQRGIGNDWY